jgi:hypothetical protein
LYGVTKEKWQMSNFSDNYHPPCSIITDAKLADIHFHRVLATVLMSSIMYIIFSILYKLFRNSNVVTGGNSDATTEHLHLMISGRSSSLFCIIFYVPTGGICSVWCSGG